MITRKRCTRLTAPGGANHAHECLCRNARGFTLIEVLISIALFAIGIVGVMSMQAASIGGNKVANRLQEGTAWASDMMETLMTRDYDHADLAGGTHALPTASNPANYTIAWTVAVDAVCPDTKTITVTATNADLRQSISLQSVKMKKI